LSASTSVARSRRRRAGKAKSRRSRAAGRSRIAAFLAKVRIPRGAWRVFVRAPGFIQGTIVVVLLVALWFLINGVYQVARKPTELFFPVSGTLNKTPGETWRQYAPLFRKYSTDVMSPALLAALAQVEGSGNPVARTYWRWTLTPAPFDVYRPASSAVGMYQITDGTFAEAKRYCIRRHRVIEDGPWDDWDSCWLNRFYMRVLPSNAVELTSAYLDRAVANALARRPGRPVPLERKQELAALIHLCGAGAGDAYVRHGLQLREGQRCGDHEARDYIARVEAEKRTFEGLMRETED
jgi:hypothetical protein